jgi:hypothetical protein
MLKPVLLSGLLFVCFAAIAEESGSPYQKWCTRSAEVEKVAAVQREEFIQECIDTLEEADRNPDKSSGRKRKGDDEG